MDDSARGMASKILCDLLNISKTDSVSANSGSNNDDNKISNGVERPEMEDVDESISETASTTSSLSPIRRGKIEQSSDVSTSDSEGVASRMSLEPVKQVLQMTGIDNEGSKSVYGSDVEIITHDSASSISATASSKIKFNSMVNYDWELKYYRGCLIAVSSKCIAYALRGRLGYVVRLLDPETASRILIKGFVGMISELAFSHKDSNTLACVDEGGNVYVWVIQDENGKLEYSVKLHIQRSTDALCEHHRLVWTPYMPDVEENAESSADEGRPLAITHGNQVEVIDIDSLLESCGQSEVTVEDVKQAEGYLEIKDGHTKPITEGALCPDGSVLATASEDGLIKFWQLSDKVECMHEFQPHGGSQLSCMMFTDSQTSQNKDLPMWRFLITGADLNREIKIWCTVTWSCLQTIRFSSPGSSSVNSSFYKVSLDLSASYLVVSDIVKKVLYIFMFHQDFDEGHAHVTSVAEFLLTQPLLSFVIGQVKLFKPKSHGEQNGGENCETRDDDEDIHQLLVELEDAGDQKGKKFGVQLQLFCIQTKAMQELHVHFQPEPSVPPPTPSTLSSLTTVAGQSVIHDALSDLSGVETGTEASTDVEEHDEATDEPHPGQPKLMTPEAFKNSGSKMSTQPEAVSSSGSSVTLVSRLNTSQGSVDELLASSLSSRVSDSTIRSSTSVTPQGCLHESGVRTPTSLPLPASPTITNASEPSTVPIPYFQSSPRVVAAQNETEPEASLPDPLVPVTVTRTEAAPFSLMNENLRDRGSGSRGATPKIRSGSASPVNRDADIEVSVDDDAKDEGAEELPESQKPEAETQGELNERDRKSSSGSSTSESLRPLSARATGNLINLDDNERGKGEDVQAGVQDVDELEERWGMNVEDDLVATGRESPESAHALPVGTPATSSVHVGTRQLSALSSLVSTPVNTMDIAPQAAQGARMDGEVLASLGELLSLIQSQQQDIQELRQQINLFQDAQKQNTTAVAREVQDVEERLAKRLENSLNDFSRDESQRLDKALREKHSGDKKRHEQLQNSLSQSLTNSLSGKLEKAVKAEVKSVVLPAVQKVLSTVQEQLNTTLTQKLTATDTVMKDSIGKLVRSKGVVDAIGGAAATALQGPIQVTYREAFQRDILPSFERACQSMFQQINDSFHKGTQQYLHQVTAALDGRRGEEKESLVPVLQRLEAQTSSFQAITEKMSSNILADFEVMLQKQLSSSLEGLRGEIFSRLLSEVLTSVQDSVQKEMGLGLEGLRQQLSEIITSSDQSPIQQASNPAKTQVVVSKLLESGRIGEAFQEALTASDLRIVVYVCETVDTDTVFSQTPCPLSQPVLLSLIQQLSVDLTVDTELKHKYIEEALMALDVNNEVTREHMPGVLEVLCQQLQSAILESSGARQRSLKMLQMAAKSLLR
ncbi:enhancer of mRNA-decapping protein 4-like isoform X1 [Acropora muricata]|uniref:enhancer of mRNA-decapping protein 4-like isoform X1 n=2 Tax=Acropora muricata TaxID=159855 RepID=UPI0034E3A595